MRRVLACAVVLTMLISLSGIAVAAPGSVPPGLAKQGEDFQSGPPEFVRDMLKFRAVEMEQNRVRVNGKPLESDLPPVIIEGRVLVPVRALMGMFKCAVEWDPDLKKITIITEDSVVELFLDDLTIIVDGEEMDLDVPPLLLGNRTFVPIRFVAMALGKHVGWGAGGVDIDDDEDIDDDDDDDDDDEDDDDDDDDDDEDDDDDDDDDE